MARRNSLTSSLMQWYIKSFQGMNNKIEENELNVQQGILAQNCRYDDEPGSAVKRKPLRYYNSSSLGSSAIKSSYRFYKSDGTMKLIVAYSTTLKVGNDTTGTYTNIATGLTDGKRWTFVTYKDLCIMSNGYDDMLVYDGSSDNVTWQLGACKIVQGTGTGITRTNISYQITIDNDAYVCGAISNIIASVTNKSIDLSNIPLGPSGTTNRKIYRQSSETSGYRLITTLSDNTTTTYTDTTADASGGTVLPAVTDNMPKGQELRLYRERLFLTRDLNNPNRIYYSMAYLPGYIDALDYMDVFPNDNDEISGVPITRGIMYCIKKNTIRPIHITSPISGADDTTWYVGDPISFNGSPAPYSITQTPYGTLYLGWDHWYLFDGGVSNLIIDEFDTTDILNSAYGDVVGHWHNGVFLASYRDATIAPQYNNRIMRYDMKRKALSIDNIDADCFTSAVGDDEVGELYIGKSSAGIVYKAETETLIVNLSKKSTFDLGTKSGVRVDGEEDSPTIIIGRTAIINDLSGNINAQTGTIDMTGTSGTYTYLSQNIRAGSFGNLYWNESFYHSSDDIQFYTRTGATQAACEAASWDGPLSNPNGSAITSAADEWFQFKIAFTANSTAGAPYIYFSGGYVIKYEYVRAGTTAETAIEFIYDTGYRNYEEPMVDKILKKIISVHEGTQGTFMIYWYTDDESQSGSFTIDLSQYPKRWESFFPSTAIGKKIRFKIYKNDLYDFKIKELKGLYTPEPIIV
jgi:hypothetical protein